MSQPQGKRHKTYADVLTWDENERIELIDGEAVMLTSPSRIHQKICGDLFFQLYGFLRGKTCQVYAAPFSVRLEPREDDSDETVLEPDIAVICDESKLDDKGCKGVPDMIVEIMSPSTARYDRMVKFRKYLEAGVREYWIVDPDTATVQVCLLKDNRYTVNMYNDADTVRVTVLEGCVINLADAFME